MILLLFDIFVIHLLGDSPTANNITVKARGLFQRALLTVIIHINKTKSGPLSLKPFKIIAKTPVIISLNGQPGFTERLQMVVYIPAAK
jgi:hypothetical protein